MSLLYNKVWRLLEGYAILPSLLTEESLLVGKVSDKRFVPLLFVTKLVMNAFGYLAIMNVLLKGRDRLPHFVSTPSLVGLGIIHHGSKECHQFQISFRQTARDWLAFCLGNCRFMCLICESTKSSFDDAVIY